MNQTKIQLIKRPLFASFFSMICEKLPQIPMVWLIKVSNTTKFYKQKKTS